MPQVIKTQPTGAFTEGGAGIGAVIFDKPQYDPQTIALKVQQDLDDWGAQKAKEAEAKKKEFNKLVGDLKFDTTGVLNNDRPKIKEFSDNTISTLTKAYQTNNPNDWAAHQQAKADLENAIKASKMDSELLKVMDDPNKLKDVGNFEELTRNAAMIRTMGIDSPERDAARKGMVGAPKKPTLNEALTTATKEYKPTTSKEVKSEKGIIKEISQEVKFTADELADNKLANQLYMSSKEVRDAANEMVLNGQSLLGKDPTQLTPEEKTALDNYNHYVDEAAKQSKVGKYVSPQVLMVNDLLEMQNYTKGEEVYKDETSAAKALGEVAGKKAEAKNTALGLIKFLSEAQAGSPEIYSQRADPQTLGGWNGVFYGTKQMGNLQYGTYNKKSLAQDKGGNAVEIETPAPNYIRYFNWDNGQLKIATDESIQRYKKGGSPDPFFSVGNISELAPTISMPLVGGAKGGDLLTAWTEVVADKKWGIGNSTTAVDVERVAGLTPEQKKKRQAQLSALPGTKTVKTVEYDPATGAYKQVTPPQQPTQQQPAQQQPADKKVETKAYKKKIGSIEYTLKNVGQEQLPLVTSEQEYNNLPKGSVYTSSDNKRYVKK